MRALCTRAWPGPILNIFWKEGKHMKRILVALLLIAALAGPAFGQDVPESMENGITMGLFENEIDLAFQANPDFGLYDQNFLFAGLGNPVSGVPNFTSLTTWGTLGTAPLRLGFFMAGSLPISLYTSMDYTDLATRTIVGDYTTNTTATVNVVSGTTTTQHRWINQSSAFSPTDSVMFSDYAFDIQALSKLGPATFGLYIYTDGDNSASDTGAANGFFSSLVDTFNYNASAGGEIPVATLNYTITKSTTNIDSTALPGAGGMGEYTFDDTLRFGIPFAMRTGDLEHVAYLDATFGSSDGSAAYSLVESLHTNTAGGASVDDITLNLTSKTNSTDIDLAYEFTLPIDASGNEWVATVDLGLGLDGNEYTFDRTNRPYNLSVLATKTALTGGTHVVWNETYANSVGITANLGGSRIFAFEPASGIVFKVGPKAGLGISSSSNSGAAWLTGRTSYTQTLDAAGALDATVAYNHTTDTVTGDPGKRFTLTASCDLPMGLVVLPEDWKFGFMLGATPSASLATSFDTSSTLVTQTTVVNYTGTTANSTTITSTAVSPASKTTIYNTTFSENHYLGITIPFDGGVRFDARLNGNLLNFESFTVQAFIPLGN